ncbi:hypothetical protein JHN59_37100 [Streptomyces sp. MBT49]|uniref:hypothetical protein n=1 Tax=unclassified Streptomyces TaxID=2593676 RepID=UPI00190E45C6|nr:MULTISPECIES: hypothetical protein [unclassified Streptomyces]MBK3630319.1 hypothetical protein [Streptomyces sp. MBT49]MBK3634706.1 hypothetical protein [Streptomyces sp. MBT97]
MTTAPFDPLGFPADLLTAQRAAAELYAALHTHQAALSWSRDPHPGWPQDGQRPGRPETPGWTAEEGVEYDRLLSALREATATVQCHGWWKRCKEEGIRGTDVFVARQALKRAPGAVPLLQGDAEQPA